ncbi:MAG: ABC transporter permease [Hyphomicrobiaceae bacterium]
MPFRIPGRSLAALFATIWRYGRILRATTEVELKKKFAGSALGSAWLVLHPLMFLMIYLFLFLVVFKVRFPDMSSLGYVVYVFAGLVPYLALMESTTAGAVAIRQNMHLVRNVIVPVELVPVRTVLMALAAEMVGLGVIMALLLVDGTLSWHVVWLPVVIALQLAMVLGLVLMLAALGVLLPDLGYAINLVMIFLMFISPIGFRPETLPAAAQPLVWLNPVHYMLESFRSSLMAGYGPRWWEVGVFAVLSLLTLLAGASFFQRFKGIIVDYE